MATPRCTKSYRLMEVEHLVLNQVKELVLGQVDGNLVVLNLRHFAAAGNSFASETERLSAITSRASVSTFGSLV